ncbi:MAG: hypothetical protein J1E60_05055 [Christensenellaceae bacterium]|nr:hypothetical protein [Christensenellaceae bacterium]
MIDIVAIVGVWLVSLVSSLISGRQPKGVDWYAPISKKQKMMMTLINISIGLLVMILSLLIIYGQLWKILIITATCVIIILYFSLHQFFRKKSGNHKEDPEKDTLLDIFSKMLTVFNSVFLLTNIAYIYYIYEKIKNVIEDNSSVIENIIANNDVLLIHGVILLWTTMSAIVITKNGWEYHREIENSFEDKKRKKHNASFFARRVTDRNI